MRFFNDIRKYWKFMIYATKSQLRSEVTNSYLDWIWWVLDPFFHMIIYTIIFGYVFNASELYFPVFVYIGVSMWGFFSRNLNASVKLIEANRGIVMKVYIPKHILLLKTMFVNGFKMMLSFAIIVAMMIFYRIPVDIHVLGIIPIFVLLFLLTYDICCLLMHFGIYLEDLGYIVSILLSMLVYFTGTFYNIQKRIQEPFGSMLEKANPVAFLISSARKVLIYEQFFDIKIYLIWLIFAVVVAIFATKLIYDNENSYVKVI